jgi:hypothetical protein
VNRTPDGTISFQFFVPTKTRMEPTYSTRTKPLHYVPLYSQTEHTP